MGRDWYWRRGAKPKPSSTSNISKRDSAQTAVSGCISAVFRLFGSYSFHCPLNHQSSSSSRGSSTSYRSKPRSSASLTSTSKDESILNIPMGLEQIKTSGGGGDIRSIANDTPRTNTPTLVARLMGLDLLPETPKPLRNKTGDVNMRGGTRSLPETPRTSSARRSDVDHYHHHHRLSLQINKDNMSASEELIVSRISSLMKRKELQHVKESVTPRKVGTNITNRVPNREEFVVHFKCKINDDSSIVKRSTHSSSKFIESKSKPIINSSTNYHYPQQAKPSPRIHAVEEELNEQHKQQTIAKFKCKKGTKINLVQRASKIDQNKKEEPFIRLPTRNRVNTFDKKCRKTPLSNDLVPVKKYPSPQSTKILQKQVLDAQRSKHGSHTIISTARDIDALIGRDFHNIKLQSVMAYVEEGEAIVAEIEGYILEALLYEMIV